MIRTITSEDLRDCARLFVRVFSEWPYEESWSVTQAHHYLSRFWKFDPAHCLLVLEEDDVIGAMFGYCHPWQVRINYYMQELLSSLIEGGQATDEDWCVIYSTKSGNWMYLCP